jgi:hypothetical protein
MARVRLPDPQLARLYQSYPGSNSPAGKPGVRLAGTAEFEPAHTNMDSHNRRFQASLASSAIGLGGALPMQNKPARGTLRAGLAYR